MQEPVATPVEATLDKNPEALATAPVVENSEEIKQPSGPKPGDKLVIEVGAERLLLKPGVAELKLEMPAKRPYPVR